jgi:sugar phosphate isomerase/epimerase
MILCSSVVKSADTFENAMSLISAAGFKDIDLIAINTWAHINPAVLAVDYDATLANVDSVLKKNNLTMRAMNIGMNKQMHDRKKESIESNLKELEALCKFMNYFGVKNAALQPLSKDYNRNPDDVLKDSVDALEEYYECTTKHGIALGLELHVHSPFESLEAAKYVYERIPEATIVFDPTHYISAGLKLEDSEFVIDKAVHVHIRDAGPGQLQAKMGEGTVDFEWIVNKLAARNYTGHYSIEYLHTNDWDALAEAVKLRDKLTGLLGL